MIGVGNSLGRFTATLGLDTKDYARGIINAQSLNRVFGQSFTAFVSNPLLGSIGLLKQVGGALVGYGGILAANIAKQAGMAESLQRTSQQLGLQESFLLALDKRMQVAFGSTENATRGLQMFARAATELKQGAGPIRELEAATGGLVDRNADLRSQLGQVLDLIQRLPTAYERSAAAASIFGRMGGSELLNAIGGGSAALAQMEREATQLGFRVDRLSNDQLAAMNTKLGYTKLAVEGIKFNAMQSFLAGLTRDADLSTESVTQLADSINNALGPALELVGRNINPIVTGLPHAINLFTQMFRAVKAEIREINDLIANPDFKEFIDMARNGAIMANPTTAATIGIPRARRGLTSMLGDTVLDRQWWVTPIW